MGLRGFTGQVMGLGDAQDGGQWAWDLHAAGREEGPAGWC